MRRSIVTLSEIKAAGFRADAEYWHPDYIANSALVAPDVKIRDCVVATVPNIKSAPLRRDFRYLEIANISVSSGEYRTVPVERGSEPDRAHYILQPDDVAVSTVRPNRNAVAFIRDDGIVGSSGLCVLRSKDLEPEYLFAFCKTDYFVKCLTRANKASMYPAVSNKDVLDTPIFAGSQPFREFVSSFVASAMELQDYAGEAYAAAESTLLAEVSLDEWQPSTRNWSIRMFSEFQEAGRMDAEYFLPKYDEITAAIKGYAGGYAALGDLVDMVKGVEVGSGAYLDAGIPFVRVSNLTPFAISEEKYISAELYANIRHHQLRQGEILLTKDATPGIAHYLREPPPPMIAAGGILRLWLKGARVNADYLTLALNSTLTRMQAERDAGGSVIRHWRPDLIAATLIPILPPALQSEIQRTVAESFALRQLSRQLLDTAKRGVEIAIEQGEPAAMAWLAAERAALL